MMLDRLKQRSDVVELDVIDVAKIIVIATCIVLFSLI